MQSNNGPSREGMLKYMEEASRIVDSWPEWKRNVLGRTSVMQKDTPFTKGDFVKDEFGSEWFVIKTTDQKYHLLSLETGKIWYPSKNYLGLTLTLLPTSSNLIIRLQACHQRRVGQLLNDISYDISRRAVDHDSSKWQDEELLPLLSIADQYNRSEYGSQEYHSLREKIAPAIQRHESRNRHHLGHFKNDISKMKLTDLLEMLCDWQASSEKNGGDVYNAIDAAAAKYKWPPELVAILCNTLADII